MFKIARTCFSQTCKEISFTGPVELQWQKEVAWLNHIHDRMLNSCVETSGISWSAFHAENERLVARLESINALLPLFHEKSTSPSMIKHGMDIVKNITQHLNSEQTPVICVDQQLYVLCKSIQYNWPSEYGTHKFVVLMGPLHIEQSFLRILGQFLEGSGWTGIVADSSIASVGSAEALLKVHMLIVNITYCLYFEQSWGEEAPFSIFFTLKGIYV